MSDDLWIYAGKAQTTDAKDKEPVVMHAPAGNMFWADDQSGQNLDIQFAVNGKKSPSLPKEFTPRATLIPNTVDETCNSLELYLNGQRHTLVERIPTEDITAPGDLRAAIMTCPIDPLPRKSLIRPRDNGNEVLGILKASDSLMLLPNPIGEVYNIDDMDESVISALFDTLAENSLLEFYEHLQNSNRDQNAMATVMVQATEHGQAYAYYKAKYGIEAARGYLKEFIIQSRFTVRKMSQWGDKLGIVFKGDRTSRTFLTAINYSIEHDKMKMLSTTLQVVEDLETKTGKGKLSTALKSANPFKGANIISFLFVSSFDVYEFFKKDIGEQNIAELLGAIGITTAKLLLAGTAAILFLAFVIQVSTLTLSGIAIFISIAGLSFAAGWGIDTLDTKFGIKDNVKSFLKNAFPNLTIEEMINKGIEKNNAQIDSYIGTGAMKNSGYFGF
ncbi:hypothetical protein GTG28_05655 [Vibrio sp. OCN044]|uniref:Uncharacterized protein n=1 Tax=Vibrio tetraodonis subsp. pristinus TaxID=2695891 RepID=A0A6L8LZR6_9VIBR|nr:hypothetical protein [Vibrio tetraodonis]MYM58702.1 hypothetical protein [Vibrio tetraodonis subsp. pristinus]